MAQEIARKVFTVQSKEVLTFERDIYRKNRSAEPEIVHN